MDKQSQEKHFWNNYLAILAECQTKSTLYTWYVRHCETFIKANKDIRLKQHTKTTISRIKGVRVFDINFLPDMSLISDLVQLNSMAFFAKKNQLFVASSLNGVLRDTRQV